MSAAADHEIRELDKALAADGQWVELQRLVGTQLIPIKVKVRAFVRASTTNDPLGTVAQTNSHVIMSPTQIIAAGWPGPNTSATPTEQDRRVPGPPMNPSDCLVINGRPRAIESVMPIYVDNQLIRIEMRCVG